MSHKLCHCPACRGKRKPKIGLFKRLERPNAYRHGRQYDWQTHTRVASELKSVDFGCGNFHDGLCAYERKHKSPYIGSKVGKGCCGGCANAIGYLVTIPSGTAKQYANRFDKRLGFWRPGKGCILPRELRSITCLAFSCSVIKPKQENVLVQILKTNKL